MRGVCLRIGRTNPTNEVQMFRKLLVPAIAAGLFATVAAAQVTIRVPKLPRSETTPARPSTNTDPIRTGGGMSRSEVIDDGLTYFDADPVKEYDSALRLDKDVGWYLRSSLRMFGTFPARSGFNVIVSRGGRQLALTRCPGTSYKKASDPYLRNAQRVGVDLGFDDYLVVADCHDKTQAVKGEGEFDVSVVYFNGDTDAEKEVRRYRIEVRRASRVRGQPTNPQPDVGHYYVSRHGDAPAAFISLIYGQNGDYFNPNRMQPATAGRVDILMNYSPVRIGDAFPNLYARCSVDGRRIDFEGKSFGDQVQANRVRSKVAVHTDRLLPQYQRGPEYKDEIAFVQLRLRMPFTYGSKEPRDVRIEDYPGNWVCDVMANGKKFRTFRWTVGRDGRPAPHPEQNGNVNLFHLAYLVDVEIPPGGSDLDGRLSVNPAAGFWYGIPWTTPQGRASAAAVSRKGDPWPVPSNKKR
jgi:hypothetical protein